MNQIWANRLIAGEQIWSEVPEKRKANVKAILLNMVEENIITQEKVNAILSK